MPIIRSAKKALRQTKKRTKTNIVKRDALKLSIKQFRKMVQTGKTKEAKEQLKTVFKKLDKAAKTDLLKRNTASRLKSRLNLSLNKMK
jgi:small subunit ribosomal protein S20